MSPVLFVAEVPLLKGRRQRKAWRIWKARPSHGAAAFIKTWGARAIRAIGSRACNPRNPPGGELTPPEKAANRAISSIRIRIEHAIGGVKRDRMVKDKIRLLKDGIRDTIMETCGGLHTFRLPYRPWNYAD
jgi:hypothetical protein